MCHLTLPQRRCRRCPSCRGAAVRPGPPPPSPGEEVHVGDRLVLHRCLGWTDGRMVSASRLRLHTPAQRRRCVSARAPGKDLLSTHNSSCPIFNFFWSTQAAAERWIPCAREWGPLALAAANKGSFSLPPPAQHPVLPSPLPPHTFSAGFTYMCSITTETEMYVKSLR